MTGAERAKFAEMLLAIYGFYGKEGQFTDSVIAIWWSSVKSFDILVLREAFSRHVQSPDAGKFLPKPADIIGMIGGSTRDHALVALHAFEESMSKVGSYYSVAFDDPLIHVVCEELGGWHACCMTKLKDWEFRRNEFLARYRAYRFRGETPKYMPVLTGVVDAENSLNGYADDPRVKGQYLRLIGDPEKAKLVMLGGSDSGRLRITDGAGLAAGALKQLESKQ